MVSLQTLWSTKTSSPIRLRVSGLGMPLMDNAILHHFETMLDYSLLVFALGNRIIPWGFLGGALHGFRNHPQYVRFHVSGWEGKTFPSLPPHPAPPCPPPPHPPLTRAQPPPKTGTENPRRAQPSRARWPFSARSSFWLWPGGKASGAQMRPSPSPRSDLGAH